MGTEALVSLIVAVLGLIYKHYQESLAKEKTSDENIQTFREHLAEGTPHLDLAEQHDRVSQALKGSNSPGN